jgi:hypothetical protein
MGFGNGITIGWPMTSSTRGVKLGYFRILQGCNGSTYENTYSQQLPQTTYNKGDYVQCNNLDTRVVLGKFIEELPEKYDLRDLSGPAYTSCPIAPFTGYFGFTQYCNGVRQPQTYYGPTTQTWQIGQVVRNMDSISVDNHVIINSIVTDPGDSDFATLIGPALNGCPVL